MKKLYVLLAFAAFATAANATIQKFEGGNADFENGNEFSQWLQAEDFILAADNELKAAEYDWLQIGSWNGTAQWWIFNDAGGSPGGVVANGAASNIVTTNLGIVNGFQFWNTDFSFGANVPVTGGTKYWLGLHQGTGFAARTDVYWATTNAGFGSTGREQAGGVGGWNDNGEQHAFSLRGVPEPATAGLLVLGGLAAMRRRR